MTFGEFLKNYFYWFSRFLIFVLLCLFILSPLALGIILGTFVNPLAMWLVVLLIFTVPLGAFGIYKLVTAIFE